MNPTTPCLNYVCSIRFKCFWNIVIFFFFELFPTTSNHQRRPQRTRHMDAFDNHIYNFKLIESIMTSLYNIAEIRDVNSSNNFLYFEYVISSTINLLHQYFVNIDDIIIILLIILSNKYEKVVIKYFKYI